MNEWINSTLIYLMSLGYSGIALGLMIEIIPSEIVLAYGGFLVSQGNISLVGTVFAGTVGGTIAQLFLYWAGYYGGRPFIEKYGKYVFIHKSHLNKADEWFVKYGPGVIFAARFIPVVRHAISIPAGIAKMSFLTFTTYTVLAIIPWSFFFVYVGTILGSNWQQVVETAKPYTQPAMGIAALIIVGYIAMVFYKKRRNG